MCILRAFHLWHPSAFKSIFPWAIDSLSHHAKNINAATPQCFTNSREPRVNSSPLVLTRPASPTYRSQERVHTEISWFCPGAHVNICLIKQPVISLPPDRRYAPEGQRVLDTAAFMMRVSNRVQTSGWGEMMLQMMEENESV